MSGNITLALDSIEAREVDLALSEYIERLQRSRVDLTTLERADGILKRLDGAIEQAAVGQVEGHPGEVGVSAGGFRG